MNIIKSLAKKTIPHPILSAMKRYAYYGIPDLVDALSGRREEFVPPRRKIFIGGTLYKQIGDEFFGYFRKFGEIKPHHHILDVGCGIGRMARPFINFLGPEGRYEGFDIDRAGVAWCQKNISGKVPHFRFQVADIFNKYYNPSGRFSASEYRFPYPDNAFDFAFATSVFTHMYLPDIENYIREISRVLKPGGKCLLSFFLWNDESEKAVTGGKTSIPFVKMNDYWVKSAITPEEAICHPESEVLAAYGRAGLMVSEPLSYGNWCERNRTLSYQDFVIATK